MPEPTVADALLEVLQRPYYDDLPFTARELLAIARAEKLFDKPMSPVSVRLRLNHLVKVGAVIRLDSEHVVAKRAICPPGGNE
jgi:hypothetical protein